MGSVISDVKAVLKKPGLLPGDVYYSLGGLYEQQQIAFSGLIMVFVSAVLLVFLLLLFLYESFRVAIAVLPTTLLSSLAVFIGLWLTGTELNISSMMGMTMIIGIVTEVGIFYASEYYDLPADEGSQLDAHSRRKEPVAPHRHDHRGRHSRSSSPGPGHGTGGVHAAAPGHRHHIRPDCPVTACPDRSAGIHQLASSSQKNRNMEHLNEFSLTQHAWCLLHSVRRVDGG
jgi:hypothetical protein